MAQALVKKNKKVIILGYDPTVNEDTVSKDEGIIVHRLYDSYEKKKPFRIGRFYISLAPFRKRYSLSKELENLIVTYKPDCIESYDWSGPLWLKPSVHLVVRMHGANAAYKYYEGLRSSKLIKFFEKRNLVMADSVIAVSDHVGAITKRAFKLASHYTVIHNSTDTNQFKPQQNVKRDYNQILYVGRIVKRKGLIELFKVLNILFDLNPNLYVRLAGRRNEEFINELLQLIEASKLNRVQFLDFIPNKDLPELYSRAGVFVMPSRAEAFGITAIEAMSCATPVVLTIKASGPEIVDQGKDGYLLDFTNFRESAEKLNGLLLDKAKLHAFGVAGREKVIKKFSTEVINSQNMGFYEKEKGGV
ncbi:MAG: glycosyltransferase family 4 protein [Cyclobacteriaceae bacterium]|nr:glycosyltransferase family 4 protein [Cyclobacteriaceae bacterium]